MKFCVFSDLHHHPHRYMGGTFADLAWIEQSALDNACDFVIHTGDFCHKPKEQMDYIERYRNFALPSYHVVGNHDFDHTSHEELLSAYGLQNGYYSFDCKGYRFVCLDTSYYYYDGKCHPYGGMEYFKHPEGRETVPSEEIAWLEQVLWESPYPCVLLSHCSLEREVGGIKNREAVQKVIREANRRKPHTVLLCINGHHHSDHVRILDGVCYWDLNSASFYPIDSPHAFYPQAITDEFSVAHYTLVYNDPLHAIVTLEGTTIHVEGMESSMLLDVGTERVGHPPFDPMGRPIAPKIQSFSITL